MAFTRTLAVGHCLPIALVTLATVSASVRADDFDHDLKKAKFEDIKADAVDDHKQTPVFYFLFVVRQL